MKRIHYSLFLVFFALTMKFLTVFADSTDEKELLDTSILSQILSLQALEAQWTFSGMAINESGERYPYFFQIERHHNSLHGLTTVLDGQTNAILFYEESNALINQPEQTHWQVGSLFLRFNPITQSWVFGVKNKKKQGFNFKVDMLEQTSTPLTKQQALRAGIELLVSQTGRLNGHLQIDGKEQFVTAKKAWFRQIWASKPQISPHPITTVLCEFNNGSGFYSVNIPESDTLRGSVASWRDEQGSPVSMSQFVTVEKENEASWQIRVPAPKITLSFANLLSSINGSHQLIAGIVNGDRPGFCAITQGQIASIQVENKAIG